MSQSDPFDLEQELWEVTFVRDQLHFAAQDGNVEEVQRRLAAGYQLNRFDEIGGPRQILRSTPRYLTSLRSFRSKPLKALRRIAVHRMDIDGVHFQLVKVLRELFDPARVVVPDGDSFRQIKHSVGPIF